MNISKEVRRDLVLRVDEQNLLEEWQGQAAMMLDYGIKLADARQDEDEARAELSVVAAELDGAIRNNPEEYDVAKVTETSVAAAIPIQEEHQTATKAFNDARQAVRVLQAAVIALEHRKSTLKGMTDLWLRQYYADPTSPSQPKEVKDAVKKVKKLIPGRKERKGRKRSGS